MDFQNPSVRRRRLRRFRPNLTRVRSYFREHRKVLSIVLVAVFLFYWYEVRPMRVNNHCTQQASVDAKALLRSKAEVATDPARKQSYADLVQKNMYLRSDHESYYSRCLRSYGFNI